MIKLSALINVFDIFSFVATLRWQLFYLRWRRIFYITMCTVQCARSCPVHSVPGDGLTNPPSKHCCGLEFSTRAPNLCSVRGPPPMAILNLWGGEGGGEKLIPAAHPVGQFPAILSLYLPVSRSLQNEGRNISFLYDTVCQFPEGCRIILVSFFHSSSYVNRLIQRSNMTWVTLLSCI